eukprot:891431-Ditylum_brightwellii.AAC.1
MVGIHTCTVAKVSPSLSLESNANNVNRPIMKPKAPLQSLLPATRFRIVLEQSIQITKDLTTHDKQHEELVKELEYLLFSPQNLTQSSSAM